MALKIRLRKQGANNQQTFRLVVMDERANRDGPYVEMLGWYQPIQKEESKLLSVDKERVQYWLSKGAILSEKAKCLVKRIAPEIIEQLHSQEILKRRKKAQQRKKANTK